jgi:hypothetical protein
MRCALADTKYSSLKECDVHRGEAQPYSILNRALKHVMQTTGDRPIQRVPAMQWFDACLTDETCWDEMTFTPLPLVLWLVPLAEKYVSGRR